MKTSIISTGLQVTENALHYCSLSPMFIVKENTKFQLEMCENNNNL